MRSILPATAAALGLALSLGLAAPAAAQDAAPKAGAGQSAQPQVKTVSVVDFADLPEDTKAKVQEVASKASEEDLKGLRTAIDKSPAIKKALADKGADSSKVIVANLDQTGTLTLVTKMKG